MSRPVAQRHADLAPIPAEAYGRRLEHAREAMSRRGAAALLVGVGADLRYLTGYAALPLERLTMLVIGRRGTPSLVAPRLEAMAAARWPAAAAGLVEIVPWDETDDAHALVARLLRRARSEGDGDAGAGELLVSGDLWAMHVLALQHALPGRAFGSATTVLRELRMVKGPEEVERLRRAARAADRVVAAIAAGRLVGRTEADVAREVQERLVAEGHDEAKFSIVASGPNSASPHHDAGDRIIAAGDPIVLDIGGTYAGYGSDITRTLWVTGGDPAKGPTEEFRRIFDLVLEANRAATAAVRPGIACEAVDAAARSVISAGGYGPQFLHRTGHGIGLDGHEDPYIVAGNEEALAPGHAFSIEPGIYVADRHGVRIEDIVICGDGGPIVLNEASRELLVVAG